jgi:hypothetical protein
MSTLHDRLQAPGRMGDYHPYGTGATPMVMPLARVEYDGASLSYDTMHPIVGGDVNAGPIPATGDGAWGQVVAAGRP